MSILLENKGFESGAFFIPPFTVKRGEITVLFLHGGAHYFPLKEQLTKIFTGLARQEEVTINERFVPVKHYTQSSWSEKLFPATTGRYLEKHSKKDSDVAAGLYKLQDMSPQRRLYSMEATERKWLDIFVALSHSRNIILDFAGQSPHGIGMTMEIVRQQVKDQGAAIILDNWPDLQQQCDQFIPVVSLQGTTS
ncbi:hypothetical protein ACTHGU_20635 [Chitinophagaceae bacterium MMS25-I14]